jgi:uncharacterized repeat protein (TIGR03803 family)
MKKDFHRLTVVLVLFALLALCSTAQAAATLRHEFAGAPGDGSLPYGGLLLSGDTLYGMTNQGGFYDRGTLFSMATDGAGFTLLHTFGGKFDGYFPSGGLILDGAVLYGMTSGGGERDGGTIFKYDTGSSALSILHSFGAPGDGKAPLGELLLSGGVLYGMTPQGGANDIGTIFKINTDGTSYTLLREFSGQPADGDSPMNSLILDGSTLYGMTVLGGTSNKGTIFKINTAGGDFSLLRSFAGNPGDGGNPYGKLVQSGTVLYGLTASGGSSDLGTIFKLETSGANFSLLHQFSGGADDGSVPYGSPILSGGILYGVTGQGGDANMGVVFSIASTLVSLRSFTGLRSGADVVLQWETGAEIANAGFHVWRSLAKAGPYARITQTLIAAEGSPSQGANYTYTDRNRPERTWYYKLEDIDNRGKSTFHGPIAVAMTAPLEANITLVSPANGSALASTPLSFTWSGEGFAGYRLQFCASENFTGRVITVPLLNWVKAEAYTPTRFVWNNVRTLGKNGAPIYWRVVGKQGKTTVASEAFVLK